MNEFQTKCKALVERILGEKRLHVGFAEAGQHERYLIAKLELSGQTYEIYIYEDEAGMGVGDDWFICEKPDFSSTDELMAAFGRILSEKIR